MPPPSSPSPASLPPALLALALGASVLAPLGSVRAQSVPPTSPSPRQEAREDTLAPDRRNVPDIERALLEAGLENVSVRPGTDIQILYENRRYRHTTEALGRAHVAASGPVLVGERRLDLIAAQIQTIGSDSLVRFRVLYPSDHDFPRAPAGLRRSSTHGRADVDLGVLLDYRVGQIFDPLQVKLELEPRLRLNPWPGAAVRLGLLFPLQNDFPVSDAEPDLNHIRPGRMSVDQFLWVPGTALVSISGGYFGDNRWGFSAGVARPLAQGEWLLDVQVDRTGFLAFPAEGTLYSSLDRTSGFAGATYRPPFADVALSACVAEFLYGDRGVEFEARRSLGDLDVGYFVQRTEHTSVFGVRLDLPVPPMTRAAGVRVRVQPTSRFAMDFRDNSEPIGVLPSGMASREDYLRQLSRPALSASVGRYAQALGHPGVRPPPVGDWVSFTGMTGFINTPWSGVLADRGLEAGFNFVPRRWSNDRRGSNDNQVFYTTLGFLPRVETSLRWTRIPGYHSFQEIAPDSKLVDMDRMASGRLELLRPGARRPGLAVGAEDVQGTRRFHSTYAVAGLPFSIRHLYGRASLGYGFRLFEAHRYLLDGIFGAAEISPWRWVRSQIEYDSEKWNLGFGFSPGAGLQFRASLLNVESLSVGAGWSHTL